MQDIPRCLFANLPTPIVYLPRLTKALGGPHIYIKRDDLTGISTGGNKIRKLEFIMADVLEKKATDLITQGATQTNHGCQTSGVAAKFGLTCHH